MGKYCKKKEQKMKDLTADKVLKKTFEHLDTILDEKSRQIKKESEESQTTTLTTKTMKQGTKKKEKVNLLPA